MKVSARNAFSGIIVDIKKGATTAHVVIDVNGIKVTAAITNEAVDDLALKVGGSATAIVKSSDVIVAVE
ncbi:TOBE domain-containing protein [Xanthobacter aminoxidans]|uniref:TOBE domain-containing protein n=1 Tax=Xanthobacter aminoxidans TaxID=186280 RepID=UPI003728CDA7